MRFEENKKYNTIALLALAVVAFAALLISIALNFSSVREMLGRILSVMAPLIYAFIIFLVLLPASEFFEKRIAKLLRVKKNPEKKAFILSVICAYFMLALVVALCVLIIIPQFATLYGFATDFADSYLPNLTGIAADISENSDFLGDIISNMLNFLRDTLTKTLSSLPDIASKVAAAFGNVVTTVSDWLLALIISVYVLLRRERLGALLRKTNAALFKESTERRMARHGGALYRNLMWFFSARAYNTIAVAIVTYLIFLSMGLKFYSVISLIISICSFVPIFGMLVGGGISALIVLVTDTKLTGWFILVFIAIMLLDYILLRPRITNKKVKLPFGTTLICVLLGYFVWDLLGALFALPVYVTLRDIIIEWHNNKKEEKRSTVSNSAK